MASYKVHYFGINARSEYIKVLLEDAGVAYEHVSYNFGDHKKLPVEHCPFGQLPVLQEGDFWLAQTNAIIHYIAKKHGLMPSDPKQAARAEEVLGAIFDTFAPVAGFVYMKKGTKEEIHAHLNKWLGHLENLLKRNHDGKGFAAGDSFCYADLVLFNLLEDIREGFPSTLKPHPVLVAFHDRTLAARPKLAAYLKSERRFHIPLSE